MSQDWALWHSVPLTPPALASFCHVLDSVLLVEQRALRCGPCSPGDPDSVAKPGKGQKASEAWRVLPGPVAGLDHRQGQKAAMREKKAAGAGKEVDLMGESVREQHDQMYILHMGWAVEVRIITEISSYKGNPQGKLKSNQAEAPKDNSFNLK